MTNQNRFLSTPFVQQMFIVKNAYINGIREGNPTHLLYYRINGIKTEEIDSPEFEINPSRNNGLLINKTGSGGGVAILEILLTSQTTITTPARKAPYGGLLELTLVLPSIRYDKIYEVSANKITLRKVSYDTSGVYSNFRIVTNEKQFSCNNVVIDSDYIFDTVEDLKAFVDSLPATGTLTMPSSFQTYYVTRNMFIEHGWNVIEPVVETVEE